MPKFLEDQGIFLQDLSRHADYKTFYCKTFNFHLTPTLRKTNGDIYATGNMYINLFVHKSPIVVRDKRTGTVNDSPRKNLVYMLRVSFVNWRRSRLSIVGNTEVAANGSNGIMAQSRRFIIIPATARSFARAGILPHCLRAIRAHTFDDDPSRLVKARRGPCTTPIVPRVYGWGTDAYKPLFKRACACTSVYIHLWRLNFDDMSNLEGAIDDSCMNDYFRICDYLEKILFDN